jgi:hypothetical protein
MVPLVIAIIGADRRYDRIPATIGEIIAYISRNYLAYSGYLTESFVIVR